MNILLIILKAIFELADFIAALLTKFVGNTKKMSRGVFCSVVVVISMVFVASLVMAAYSLTQSKKDDSYTQDSSSKIETTESEYVDNSSEPSSEEEKGDELKENQNDTSDIISESDKYRVFYESYFNEIATQINDNRYTDTSCISIAKKIKEDYFGNRFVHIDKSFGNLNEMNIELNDNIDAASFLKELTDMQNDYEQRNSELIYGDEVFKESDLISINAHISDYNSINEKIGYAVPFIVNRIMLDYTTKSIIINKYKTSLSEQGIIDEYVNPNEFVKKAYLDAITYQLYDMAYGNHKYDKCGFEHNNAITEYYFAMTNYNLAQTVEDEVHKAAYYCISILFFEESAESNLPPEYTPQHNLSQVYYELSLLPINGKNNSYYRQMSDYYAEF